MSEEVSCN